MATQLEIIADEIEQSRIRTEGHMAEIDKMAARSEDITNTLVSELESLKEAQIIQNEQTKIAEARAQNANIANSEAVGGYDAQVSMLENLDSQNARIAELQAERVDIYDDEITGIGLIDSIFNDFRAIQTEMELDAATAQRDATKMRIATTTQAQEQFASINAKTQKTINTATIEASNREIAARANAAALQAEREGLQFNAKMLTLGMSADSKQLDQLFEIQRLQQTEQANELRQLQLDQAKKDLENEAIADADIAAGVNATLKTFGQQEQNEATIIRAIKSGGELGKHYQDLFLMSTTAGPEGNIRFGNNQGEAFIRLQQFDPNGNIDNQYVDRLRTAQDRLQKMVEAAPGNRSEEELLLMYQKEIDELTSIDAAEIDPKDSTNVYQAPPMETLGKYDSVAQSPLFSKIPQVAAMTAFDYSRIKEYGLAAIEAGTITPEDFIGSVVVMGRAIRHHNNSADGGLARFGFPLQQSFNVRSRYKTELKVSPGIGIYQKDLTDKTAGIYRDSSAVVDLMDYNKVELDLVKSLTGFTKRDKKTTNGDN